jgi:DNA-binding transcriptional MerR regulator/methylmalonyl-CoA mutase cobalamin-binding subunit
MSKQESEWLGALPISAVERETGLSKDVLRKWEVRYGFPVPGRDAGGERLYPAEQVSRLRLIKRLLDAGMRPSRIVTQPADILAGLAEGQQQRRALAGPEPVEDDFLQALRQHDTPVLRQSLIRLLYQEGLQAFVQDRIAGLVLTIGEAWARGELDIHEEHLFSEVVQNLLRGIVEDLNDARGKPRILLTTLPGEPHGLGLLMVAALASLEGGYCLSLGTQTPAQDIANAALAREMDVVALSFSATFPARRVMPALEELRQRLPATNEIWVGGEGAVRSARPLDGIRLVADLADLSAAIADWRQAHLQ